MNTIYAAGQGGSNSEVLLRRIGDILKDGISVTDAGGTGSNMSIGSGRKEVAVAGTAETLAASTTCSSVTIQAEFNNTGVITIGDASVVAAEGTRVGVALGAEDSITINIDDLEKIFLDTTVSTDGVTFVYFN